MDRVLSETGRRQPPDAFERAVRNVACGTHMNCIRAVAVLLFFTGRSTSAACRRLCRQRQLPFGSLMIAAHRKFHYTPVLPVRYAGSA